ncbi:MAG TPA: hypothetical protein VHH36_00195, partial [Candidatus Thermoplasmatota archaeon]|nr:hypothetical protein [Candidatus Thermoplasmatota archaeon]
LGTSLPTGATPEDISRWSFLLLVLVLAAVWAQAGSIRRSADVVHLSLAALVGALLVSKVVNEQYFVMPVALATVAFALSERPVHLWLRRLYTFGGFLSGVLLGYHFFTFLPVDVAEAIFPWDPLSTVPRLTRALGWTDEQAFVYPTLLAAASLVPAMLLSVAFVGRQLAAPLRDMPAMLRERRMPVAAVAVLLTFLVVAPASAAILATRASPDPTDGFEPPEGPLVGAYYYMWWNNPAHDPGIEYGNWRNGVSQVPEDGYYTTTAGKMRNDFRAMRAAGVDIVVYVYHGYDKPKLPALVRLAAETGVTTAPLLDLHDLVDRPDARPRDANGTAAPVHWGLSMRNETRDAIVERILDPLADFSHFPTWWRIDDKPVVFLRPADRVFYDADGPTREALVDAAWRIAREDERLGLAGPAPAREALAAQAPGSPEDLRLPGNSLWRRAYHETVRAFWQGVSDGVAERLGPIHLVGSATWDPTLSSNRGAALSLATQGATNASFAFSLSDVWQNHFGDGYGAHLDRWRDALATRAQAARSAGETLFATVTPGYDDRPLRKGEGFVVPYEDNGTRTYERQWDDAAAARPDVILVDSWNDFHSGTAVEPTLDRGDALLRLTAERAAAWKAGPAREAPSVLLVTDHLGAAYHNDSGDPDGAYAFSVRLARAAERWAPGRVAAVDWNGPALATTDLSAYDLVVVEPGAKWPRTADALALVDRLRNHSLSGGAVLLLGSDVGVHYARLANWTEPPLPTARLRLDHEPAYEIPVDPWTARHDLPPGARVLLWMTDGRDRYPALWEIPLGDGTLAVTAFRPQGASDADPIDPAVFPLVLARARSHEVAP